MIQIINVNVPIQIPDNFILIEKDEHNHLLQQDLMGRTWTMNDVRDRLVNKDARWIREKILLPNKKTLSVENGGFVSYPKNNGDPWKFGALRMARYLEDNWGEYFK